VALACVGGAYVTHQSLSASASDEQRLQSRNDANRKVVALAELVRRDIEKLIPTAIAAASVQELQEMVRQGADAATFQDFMSNESNWRGYRTAPLSSALYLDHQRLAQTSDAFPDDAAVRGLVENPSAQGRGKIVSSHSTLVTVVGTLLPAVTRGEAPKEAVLTIARPLDLSAQDGAWLFSDGKRVLASNGSMALAPLVGKEAQTPIALPEGTASASEVHPGLWAWSLAPLPPPPRIGPPASVIFGVGGLLALGVLVFAFRASSSDEKEKLIVETNAALRQSQEQLKRLSQQLQTQAPARDPRESISGPLARTSPSLEILQPSRYEVVAPLGEGGMAKVYLAVTRGAEGFKRAFVLKRLRSEVIGNPDAVTQFIDEARLGSSLVHSNIVPVFDFGRDAEGYYLAQEYILGRDLDAVRKASLDQRRTPIEQGLVLYVAQETLKALDYAHNRTTDDGKPLGLVHRDVSPNNLMISAQGEVKLLDLGIAKSDENVTKTQAGMVKGNVFYMSPEQARGEPIDGRADLFSLGLVLFTAATGDTLYQGASNYELLSRAGKGLSSNEWQRVAALPPELSTLLKRVLQTDPSDRYASAMDFAAAIPPAAIGRASAMQALMNALFAEEFRREQSRLQSPSRKT
jgi:hypothetical protein